MIQPGVFVPAGGTRLFLMHEVMRSSAMPTSASEASLHQSAGGTLATRSWSMPAQDAVFLDNFGHTK